MIGVQTPAFAPPPHPPSGLTLIGALVSIGTQRIVCARNSQMASSLFQTRVLCSTLTMSSFPLEIEKNIQAMKLSRFWQWRRTRDWRNPRWFPGFSFAQIRPLLWSFSRFWWNFIEIEVLNDEEYSILCILYCYSLQQHISLAFCNDFDTHYRMFAYILVRNKTLLSRNGVISQLVPFSALFLGREHGKEKFYKLWKFIQN